MINKKIKTVSASVICLSVLIITGCIFTQKVSAQDFYGEGNVLIAVDMGAYAENEDVYYREGSMGTLMWGDDAPTGVSTRAPFEDYTCTVSDDVTAYKCPDYEIETVYHVGQKCFLPYFRDDDPDYCFESRWFSSDAFPREVFENDEITLLYNSDCIKQEGQDVFYEVLVERISEEEYHPCYDYLEIECVGISEYGTVWRYTGAAYSTRTGFDTSDYGNAVTVSDENLKSILDAFDEAYFKESDTFGDPRLEDSIGDRDGKAACIILDFYNFKTDMVAFYCADNTYISSFDSIFLNLDFLEKNIAAYVPNAGFLHSTIMHEYNHYLMLNSLNDDADHCLLECFADYSFLVANPDKIGVFAGYADSNLAGISSRLRLIPGMLWGSGSGYSNTGEIVYTLGGFFLSYVERLASGRNDGRFWTDFFSDLIPGGSLTCENVDGFLKNKTGYGLNDWLARFMADVVTESDEAWAGTLIKDFLAESGIVQEFFLRPYEEYGKNPGSFDSAVDKAIEDQMKTRFNLYTVRGGGTTYAYRNDAGGRIAITDADDDWYFFAVNMDLPDSQNVIEISTAEELAKIGCDPEYPMYGEYILTSDIDLGGEENPWNPIGSYRRQFTGMFEGNGHTISGLYVNAPDDHYTGLFGYISGDAVIRNLTVSGSVTGGKYTGGIAGRNDFGKIFNCTSHVSVRSDYCSGGISGYNDGIISECTSYGPVISGKLSGGIAGYNPHGTVINCSNKVPGIRLVGGGTGYTVKVDKTGKAKLVCMDPDTTDTVIQDHITVGEDSCPIAYIRKKTFEKRKELQSVTMGENIIAIGKNAFRGDSQLKNIELTGSVIRIGKNAFKGIDKDAVFKIRASEEDFERVVALIKAAGVEETVVFERGNR